MIADLARDRIRKLRTVGQHADPLARRLALERALSIADLRPRGLPPRAIVCVRSIRVKSPYGGNLDTWVAGLNDDVGQLLSGSVRPFRDTVPANANAVVFYDEAELLACLARDWRRGDGRAWWWVSLFGTIADERLVQIKLAEAPMFVPAAVKLLANNGCAQEVLSAIAPAFCEQLCTSVADTFGVISWRDAAAKASSDDRSHNVMLSRRKATTDAAPDLASLLRDVIPDLQTTILAPEQRMLMALSIIVQRKPNLATHPHLFDSICDIAGPTGFRAVSTVTRDALRTAEVTQALLPEHGLSTSANPSAPPSATLQIFANEPTVQDTIPSVEAITHTPATDVRSAVARDSNGAGASSEQTVELEVAEAPRAAGIVENDDLLVVESNFAGTLYLINLSIQLDLYADFTQPLRRNLDLAIGEFLALIGGNIHGIEFRHDPLWTILARISGHTADDELTRDVETQYETEWAQGVIDVLESQAARLLDIHQGAALQLLCSRPGTVALTSTRLDATFHLVDHPFAIRASGLDRNPGWVPAAGRVIEFHYE